MMTDKDDGCSQLRNGVFWVLGETKVKKDQAESQVPFE